MGEREANGARVCQALLELEASIGSWEPKLSLLSFPLPGHGLPHGDWYFKKTQHTAWLPRLFTVPEQRCSKYWDLSFSFFFNWPKETSFQQASKMENSRGCFLTGSDVFTPTDWAGLPHFCFHVMCRGPASLCALAPGLGSFSGSAPSGPSLGAGLLKSPRLRFWTVGHQPEES